MENTDLFVQLRPGVCAPTDIEKPSTTGIVAGQTISMPPVRDICLPLMSPRSSRGGGSGHRGLGRIPKNRALYLAGSHWGSRGVVTSKIHLAADSRCRPISRITAAGHRHDSLAFELVMAGIKILRRGRGRPRTKPGMCCATGVFQSGYPFLSAAARDRSRARRPFPASGSSWRSASMEISAGDRSSSSRVHDGKATPSTVAADSAVRVVASSSAALRQRAADVPPSDSGGESHRVVPMRTPSGFRCIGRASRDADRGSLGRSRLLLPRRWL